MVPAAPLLLITTIYETKYTEKAAETERKGVEQIVSLSTEAIANIRTVASLGLALIFYVNHILLKMFLN